MQMHEQRVVEEKASLDEKLTKLSQFISASPVFQALGRKDRELLREQRECMLQYSEVLEERVARFKP